MPSRFLLLLLALSFVVLPELRAVPPADFGLPTPGGYGGRIIKVTNLNSSGSGSLRAALQASGPRIVVFEVGGVIDLGRTRIDVENPYLTIAGQTAPEPGITIIKGWITFRTHDVLVQHIRVRPGDAGQPKGSGWEPDGLSTDTRDGAVPHNIVFANCSVSWAVDENLSVSGPIDRGPYNTSYNITFYRCIIAEGLRDSSHSQGEHSMGSLIHDYARNIAVIECIYESNNSRNPRFKTGTTGVVINNLISNPGGSSISLDWNGNGDKPAVAVVGNVQLLGGDSGSWNMDMITGEGRLYADDNQNISNFFNLSLPTVDGNFETLDRPPVWPEGVAPIPSSAVPQHLLQVAGARPGSRDAIDERIITDVANRTGDIIDSQTDAGGYPNYALMRRALSAPAASNAQAVEQWLRDHNAAVMPSGWERVRAGHFAATEAPLAATAELSDWDNDSLPNQAEAILSTDLRAGGPQPLQVSPVSDGLLQLKFRYDPAVADMLGFAPEVYYVDDPQASDGTLSWSRTPPTGVNIAAPVPVGGGLEEVVHSWDADANPEIMARLEFHPGQAP